MISDNNLIFFIVILLAYLFEGKILPSIILIGFDIIYIVANMATMTEGNFYQSILLFILLLIYISANLFKEDIKDIHDN